MSRSSPGSLTLPLPLFLFTEWPSQANTSAPLSATGLGQVSLQVPSSMFFSLLNRPLISLSPFRRLVHAFPQAALGIALAKDSILCQSDVFLASHTHTPHHPPTTWGDRPVLLLIGLRLGIDGVNPIYYETIKVCPISIPIPPPFPHPPSSSFSRFPNA